QSGPRSISIDHSGASSSSMARLHCNSTCEQPSKITTTARDHKPPPLDRKMQLEKKANLPKTTACRPSDSMSPDVRRPLVRFRASHNTEDALLTHFTLSKLTFHKEFAMSRSGAVTFKGTPLTLAGEAV